MKNQEIIKMIRIPILITLLMPFLTQYSYSQLSAPDGVIDLRNQQLSGDNDASLTYDSNNSDVTRLTFRDKEHIVYGGVYGSDDGADFGLLDGDGNWSYWASKDSHTSFRINGLDMMRIKANGNVGIRTTDPLYKLEVNGSVRVGNGNWGGLVIDGKDRNDWVLNSHNHGTHFHIRTQRDDDEHDALLFVMTFERETGNAGIGTTKPQHKLDVCGTIRAEEVIVEEGWCEYVFEPEYCLTTLEEEAEFIKLYGHLSNFESAKKMDGLINVNDIFKRQQVQIEENVLHLIELNEENSALQNEVTNLGAEVEHLTEKINSLTTNYEMLAKEMATIKAQLR